MRAGFSEIVSGWMLVDDFEELTDRIERSAAWVKENGPLEPDERATIRMMVESQVARGIALGDFDFLIDDPKAPLRVICCNCERDCTVHHFMCDRDDGEWCPDCWENTACSQGVHGEGCLTQVFSDA